MDMSDRGDTSECRARELSQVAVGEGTAVTAGVVGLQEAVFCTCVLKCNERRGDCKIFSCLEHILRAFLFSKAMSKLHREESICLLVLKPAICSCSGQPLIH